MVLLERASSLKTIIQIGAIDDKTRALAKDHVRISVARDAVGHRADDHRGADEDRP